VEFDPVELVPDLAQQGPLPAIGAGEAFMVANGGADPMQQAGYNEQQQMFVQQQQQQQQQQMFEQQQLQQQQQQLMGQLEGQQQHAHEQPMAVDMEA
jgi:hypothetical protein